MAQSAAPLLEARALRKSFGAVKAVREATFDIGAAEVVAFVGDNGAGKSTVIKMLSGAHRPDDGEISFAGQSFHPRDPEDARRLGIETLYQDLALANDIDAPGNIFLGHELTTRKAGFIPWLDKARMRERARELLARIRIELPSLDQPVRLMSGGQRQAAAIARILRSEATRLIIMDEPTAALGVQETRKVLDLIGSLNEEGLSVIVVMHNLEQVFAVAHRVVVMRGGTVVGTVQTDEVTPKDVVNLIVGAEESR
ncbi:MAG: ATP-binding cassette domain-containing protein [Azospirillaceae bacterium]